MNHISYRGYYRDEESGFYYLQSRYYDPDVCRFVNADDVNVLIESCKEETDNIFEYNNYIYCNSDPISYTDASGYSVKEWVNNQVGLSDFSIIHSGKDNIAFNCYGDALNIYSGYSLSRLNPGKISNRDYPFSSKIKSITIDEMAKLVKKDAIKLGRSAKILQGKDNSPYYVIDKKHYLIALRLSNRTNGIYDYHFMKRSGNDIWSFKGGWLNWVFELRRGYNPNMVDWDMYTLKNFWKKEKGRLKSYKKYVVYKKKSLYRKNTIY